MSQRLLISGSTGFIGSHLTTYLSGCGYSVLRLVRQTSSAINTVYWNPAQGQFSKATFEDFDAVIHLAGTGLAQGRWTKKKKQEFISSRVHTTRLLSQILSELEHPPKTVVCVSAVGFYGNRNPNEILTEASTQGQGFLADLCGEWEAATHVLERRGVRVVHPRFGIVLSEEGGMLKKLLPIFRWGLGGKVGNGKQMISWIALADLMKGIEHVLCMQELRGPVNFVAPHPVSQEEFARMLAKKLHRPAFCHLPAWFLKAVLGEMAQEMLLSGQNVKPEKLLLSGYRFSCSKLEQALQFTRH